MGIFKIAAPLARLNLVDPHTSQKDTRMHTGLRKRIGKCLCGVSFRGYKWFAKEILNPESLNPMWRFMVLNNPTVAVLITHLATCAGSPRSRCWRRLARA